MKRPLWSAVLAIVSLSVHAFAQDSVRLQLTVYKNGAVVSSPTVAVAEANTASVTVNGVGAISVSPTRLDAERTAINLHVESGDKTMRPRLVLIGSEPGVMKWQSPSDAYELRVSVAR
jgi:hypothetical protein